MIRDEIATLMQQIAAVDNRSYNEETITTWHSAAVSQKWTYEMAVAAMRAHFAESTDWLMPGHITRKVRVIRRDQQPPLKALPAIPESVADREMRDKVMARFRKREVHTD